MLMLLVGAMGACSSGRPASNTDTLSSQYRKNEAQWALPLDSYEVGLSRLSYAGNLLTSACLKAKGIVWAAPPEIPQPPNRNAAGRLVFNLALARRLGYRGIAPGSKPPTPIRDPIMHSAAEDREVTKCLQRTNQELGDAQGISLNEDLGGAAYDEAKADLGTVKRAAAWKACMRPMGFSDVTTPWDMTTPTMDRAFGRIQDPRTGLPRQLTATPAEIKVAVFDAKCQISTGFSHYFYETEFNKQIELIAQNRDALSRLAAKVQAQNAKVQSIIAKNGG